MSSRITLGVNGDTNLIKSRLYNHPKCVFPISITKDRDEQTITYIHFDPTDDMFILDQYVNVLAEYMIERYETKLLKRILEEDYSDLSSLKKRELLKNISRFTDDPEFGYEARKRAIALSVYDYLKEDRTMLIDGFVSFRLKEYELLLYKMTERFIEQYTAQKEYEEFIGLLKYFVNVQSVRPEMVQICVKEKEGYRILNESGTDITEKCFADFLEGEFLLTEETYDDLLISILITLAPKNITVHGSENIKNKELFKTIKSVFAGNIHDCAGCPFCKE